MDGWTSTRRWSRCRGENVSTVVMMPEAVAQAAVALKIRRVERTMNGEPVNLGPNRAAVTPHAFERLRPAKRRLLLATIEFAASEVTRTFRIRGLIHGLALRRREADVTEHQGIPARSTRSGRPSSPPVATPSSTRSSPAKGRDPSRRRPSFARPSA